MPIPEWFGPYLVGIAVLQLALFWYLVRRSRGIAEQPVETAGDEVVCQECETVNEPSYRFCRSCVAELPGASPSAPGLPGPVRRWIR